MPGLTCGPPDEALRGTTVLVPRTSGGKAVLERQTRTRHACRPTDCRLPHPAPKSSEKQPPASTRPSPAPRSQDLRIPAVDGCKPLGGSQTTTHWPEPGPRPPRHLQGRRARHHRTPHPRQRIPWQTRRPRCPPRGGTNPPTEKSLLSPAATTALPARWIGRHDLMYRPLRRHPGRDLPRHVVRPTRAAKPRPMTVVEDVLATGTSYLAAVGRPHRPSAGRPTPGSALSVVNNHGHPPGRRRTRLCATTSRGHGC